MRDYETEYKKRKGKALMLWLNPEIHSIIEKLARDENRSVANMYTTLVIKQLRQMQLLNVE